MNCRNCSLLVFEYVDGTLSARRRSWMGAHFEQCPRCRAALAREMRMQQTLAPLLAERFAELTLDPGLGRAIAAEWDGMTDRVRGEAASGWRVLRPATAWLTAATCLLAAAWLGLHKPTKTPGKPASAQHVEALVETRGGILSPYGKRRVLTVRTGNGNGGYLRVTATWPKRRSIIICKE